MYEQLSSNVILLCVGTLCAVFERFSSALLSCFLICLCGKCVLVISSIAYLFDGLLDLLVI